MAALTMSSPSRQPFGLLDSSNSRLRAISHVKNVQNALAPSNSTNKPTLKRRIVSSDLSDSENVDPNILSSPAKRKRLDADDEDVLSKPTKASKFVLKPVSRSVSSTPLGSRLQSTTPRAVLGQRATNAATPLSAPAAAGRSPVRAKARGVRRLGLTSASSSASSSPYSRLKPRKSSAAPFSLAAALKGTIPSARISKPSSRLSQPTASIEESIPSSWIFDIHEDTPDEEAQILMEHSACTLDISSDDEDRIRAKLERGKENIAPETVGIVTTVSTAVDRTDIMSDGARTPLGDLDAKDYFPEGCDESSVFVVREDDDAETVIDEEEQHAVCSTSIPTSSVPTVSKQELDSLLESLVPAKEEVPTEEAKKADIEIWESGSAADEAEKEERGQENIFA